MKTVKNESTDAHQPSGPLPIPKGVEEQLKNWFSLPPFDRRQIVQQILRRILHIMCISDSGDDIPPNMDFYTDIGYVFWEADIVGSYRAVFGDDTVNILRYDLLNFLEFATDRHAVSYRRDYTGYYWQVLDWQKYDACCQKFHFPTDEFEDGIYRRETQEELTEELLRAYYPGKVY